MVLSRDQLRADRFRTELWLVWQLLQRVVVPEFDLDAAIQCPALDRCVRSQRPRGALAVAQDGVSRQTELVLDRQGDTTGACLRETDVVTVDARHPAGKRCIVGVSDEFHDDVLFLGKIREAPAHLLDEVCSDIDARFIELERCDQVLHPRALRVPFDVAQLAHRFHATDLDALDLVRHQEFLERDTITDLVVPDLHLDAAIQRAPFCCQVGRDGIRVAGP